MFRQSNNRLKTNRSRRGLFSAAAKSTLGQPLPSHQHRRECYSAASSQSQRKIGSARGQTKVCRKMGPQKKQQKQRHQHRSCIGNSVGMLLNDSMDDELYMSLYSTGGNRTNKSSKDLIDRQHHSLLPRSSSRSMSASQLCATDASSGTSANASIYDILDDDSMFMPGSFSPMDLSDSGEVTPVIKDFDSLAVANLVRQFVSVADDRAPQAINIARKIRELTDYNLMSDSVLDGNLKSSSHLTNRRQKSNASILSTRPW